MIINKLLIDSSNPEVNHIKLERNTDNIRMIYILINLQLIQQVINKKLSTSVL